MTNLFNTDTPAIDPSRNYLDELVGEGKKFKSVDDLARGKAEADAYIATIVRQLDETKQELNTRARLEEMLTQLRPTPAAAPQPAAVDPLQSEHREQTNGFTADDVDKLINERLTQREIARTKQQNFDFAKQELEKAFGTNYGEVLKNKASELGVAPEWVNNLATENPKALLKLVGAEQAAPRPQAPSLFSPPASQVQAQFQAGATERTQSYYKALKIKDPTTYYSNATTVQMHKDAQRLGERFFD